MTNEDDVRALVEKTVNEYGGLNYAFSNAGIEDTMIPLVEQKSDTLDQIMNVNAKGVWLSMKYEIPEIIRRGGGAIVNNSSVAGVMGFPQMPIYITSKHAVLGLTKSAAQEYAKSGIRINAVDPRGVEIDMMKRMVEDNKQFEEMLKLMHPVGRIDNAEEIANVVAWLLSDKASFVFASHLVN